VTDVLKTCDLFEAALAMAKGLAIASLEVEKNGGDSSHPRVTFVLEGPGAQALGLEYQAGKAEANVSLLKMCVEHLKRRMWAAIDGRPAGSRRGPTA
jgi:hypothetical protein